MSDEQSPLDARRELEERILKDSPRLGPDDRFEFSCHPGVACFNRCCGDVNIFLSPYDVLRMKKRLGMTSSDFLEKHALMPVQKDMKTPVVVLRMNDDEGKTCPFLTGEGCGIYSDRPWPCRMYPVGLASQKDTADGWQGERFYFLLQDEVCKGFEEAREWTVREWLEDQGVDEYDFWGEGFKELTLHKFFEDGGSQFKVDFVKACASAQIIEIDEFIENEFGVFVGVVVYGHPARSGKGLLRTVYHGKNRLTTAVRRVLDEVPQSPWIFPEQPVQPAVGFG